MHLSERRRALDAALLAARPLWHPQPFREARPAWCDEHPALADALMSLDDRETTHLADDGEAAASWLAPYLPALPEVAALAAVPALPVRQRPSPGPHWDWEIPGRKRAQIEAFAAAAMPSERAVIDWCGGKGHLGRLLALQWQVPAATLEIDPALCAEGERLARRSGVAHGFIEADALASGAQVCGERHLVALHACGDLHRTAVTEGARRGIAALDVAPCCYYRGVEDQYRPLAPGVELRPTRDDLRLAVTETVTASPRQARRRDRDMAWKLGFAAYQSAALGRVAYRPFKPVPASWFGGSFADFLARMAARSGLPPPANPDEFERLGWRRQSEVMRLSIVRHAFRRPLEIWLVLDLAEALQGAGYTVELGTFCPRHLTPRNLLLSARR